jgi:hypothetical protein
MQLIDHSLRQIDEAYLEQLGKDSLRSLSSKLLLDLKEARERLNQSSRNSSLPPSREAPWDETRAPDAGTGLRPGGNRCRGCPGGDGPWGRGRTFPTRHTVLYYISHRGQELVRNLLGDYASVLRAMAGKRNAGWGGALRCWAHLKRKAQSLADSLNPAAQGFGLEVLVVGRPPGGRPTDPRRPFVLVLHPKWEGRLKAFRSHCDAGTCPWQDA